MIDEIYLGTAAALAILGSIFAISLFAISGQDSNDSGIGAHTNTVQLLPKSTAGNGAPTIASQSSSSSSFSNLNPEQVLAERYEQSARDEISRCLDDSDSVMPPMCDYTLDLLLDSCRDPVSYVRACDDQRLLEYSGSTA